MKLAFLALFAALSLTLPLAAKAENKTYWVGALGGQQNQQGLKPVSYGGQFGIKHNFFGWDFFVLNGSKTVSGVNESITQVGLRLDVFPLIRLFYVSPEAVHVSTKASVSNGGVTATASVSGLLFGGAAGINLPLGPLSVGGEYSYVTGSQNGESTHVGTVLGTVKVWF